MVLTGIYWTNETPYLIGCSEWCGAMFLCGVCKQRNNDVRRAFRYLKSKREKVSFKDVRLNCCQSCFEKRAFIRPTEEELQQHILKLRQKKAKQYLNNNLINDLTNIILSLDSFEF